MKKSIGTTAILLGACNSAPSPQPEVTASQPAPVAQTQSAPAAAPANAGLGDLDAMTFACVKAGLNAAAREAAKVPSQGTYQFSYFRIVSDSHHASYEVHFKSNYQGEAQLKYCVAIYCQQGWDPKTTKALVWRMGSQPEPAEMANHGGSCGKTKLPAQRGSQ
jgi:hypothetical protein